MNWWGNNTPNLPAWINNYYIVTIIKLNGEDYYILSLNGSSPVNSTIVANSSLVQIGENVLISGQFDFDRDADASLLPYFEMISSNSSGNTTYDARIPRKISNYDRIIVDNQILTTNIDFIFDIIVDGNKQNNINLSDANAIWTTEYTTNRTGNITAGINSTGNLIFQQFSNSTTFIVNDPNKNSTNSTIVVSPNPVQIGDNITVSGQLANFTGITSINVTIDGTLFNVAVDGSGGWSRNYTTNRTGSINVTVSLSGNGNFFDFSNSTTFAVNKNSTNSTVVVGNVQIGENATISGVLANFTGVTSVNVTVDGNIQLVNVDGSGGWSLNYTTNRTGSINVTVSLFGNGNFFDFSNSTTFAVNKNSTNSTVVVGNVQIGENATISGVLANFTGVTSVNVTVDGNIQLVNVDGTGGWSLNYTTNHTGTFDIVVSFAGNENYTSFSNYTSFNVTKLAVNSTVNIPSDVKVGKTITIDSVLVDENGNPIANASINVTVDGKVYHLTTDSNGRWNITYKPTHAGNVNTVVDYSGNDKYFSYTNTTTFNVVKGEAIVDIDVVKNPDGSVDVIVTVTDEDGDPIPNHEVDVDLDGKYIGNIVTDVDGIGKIHIPSNKLNDGKHLITVTSDNVNYNTNPVSVEFEIKNNNNDTNKTNNNPVASATMKNTGMPIIAIILVLLTIFGIGIRRKQN
ncbi:bacterial Ig-like domain protein [Methanobrevibacter cuticularis]|uniref:Bacterial Ig-like domain protein n=1 Tax=Methanobrevibacter cuticularis TaxID=47311 RepID=A0A166CQA1_9EURY|nr:bacterial Ig-like domain protein [Methanobrevibacter cuticularis]